MPFFQTPPRLGNQYKNDPLLAEYLRRVMPDALKQSEDEYEKLGEMAGGELYQASLQDRLNEPVHTRWDAWGHRIDHIEVSPLWKRAQELSAIHGLVAAGYENRFGEHDRVHQFAMNYIVQASLDIYSCPLAMTDGATRTILDNADAELRDRAVPFLTSRDPKKMWTSGQWMTERTGGSDVGLSETVAKLDGDTWRLSGTKWFTSATTSQMALALARPEGNGPGGKGLALFFVELRDDEGRMRGIQVNRLKDKFGTRKVPTAELTLDGTPAILIGEASGGVKRITPMLNVTRTWNAVAASWLLRRAYNLAADYAKRRIAFGATLEHKPLHVDTMADIGAEADACFHLAFRAVELLGKTEHGTATEIEAAAFRVLTPITKLVTAKQAVTNISECLECFGGAGYIEDTGLPRIYADAQVLPIWEGTTNVLSLDTLRALATEGAFDAFVQDANDKLATCTAEELQGPVNVARGALKRASLWLAQAMGERQAMEAGARRFAMTLGRAYQLCLMTAHAQWTLDQGTEASRAPAAARRFSTLAIDHIRELPHDDAEVLMKSALS